MNDLELEMAESVVRASKTDLYRRVYFLGPYARRVSFSSMQNRALNLVWALQVTRRMEKGQHVAVIGGGLSGVTATAALLDQGYKVTMYEDGENVMHRQVAATHRFIHPTVNRWPERPVEETTAVPYFDWVSAVCAEVVAKVQAEWGEVLRSPDVRFEQHATVKGFVEIGDQVGVKTESPCAARTERYGVVLVTSGFADEHYGDPRIFPGYWRPDNLEADVVAPAFKDAAFLISGCGDGGLIDALRVAHRDFRQGRLIVDVARELHASAWPGLVTIAEAEAALSGNSLRDAIDHGSEDLRRIYEEAARQLPVDLVAVLDASLRRDRMELVTILSRERNPYSPMSAPIHKLLIAHAIGGMVVRHLSQQVVEHQPDHVIVVPGETRAADLATARRERLDGRVILRHGAQPNFRKFFAQDPAAGEDLMMRQKMLAANLDGRFWRESTLPLKAWPPERGFAPALKKRHIETAELIRRMVKLPNGHIDLDDEGFFFLHADHERTAVERARLPETVFGFKLKVVSESDFKPTRAKAAGSPARGEGGEGLIRPGSPVLAALNGRLGPVCIDRDGRLFALTAGHLAPSGRFRSVPVNDLRRTMVGTIVDDDEDAGGDIVRVALAADLDVDPGYARRPTITGLIDAHEAFGEAVYLERSGDSIAHGYVTATRAAVYFRQPGSSRNVELTNVVRVRSADPASSFAAEGDSGAPVVSEDGRLLGIVVCNDDAATYVLPCARYMERHGLTLLQHPSARTAAAVEDASEIGILADIIGRFAMINRRDQAYEPLDLGGPPDERAPSTSRELEESR